MNAELSADLIDQYVDYASNSCDAPEIYHKAMGYFICSALLGRYAVTVTSFKPKGIKPNIWILLIGPSRIVRKTTALELGESIIRDVDESVILPSSFSPEALHAELANLQRGDVGVWIKDEMGAFFHSLKKKDYMSGTRELLSMVYTGRGEVRRLRNMEFKIPSNIYITCAGDLPTPVHYYLSEEDFISGFLNRFILVFADTRAKRIPFFNETSGLSEKRENIVSTFKALMEGFGRISPVITSFDHNVVNGLDKYDKEVEEELYSIESKNPESLWKSYLAETPHILLKLTTLRRLARGRPENILVVEEEDFIKAFNDLKAFIKTSRLVVENVQAAAHPRPVETEERRINRVFNLIDGRPDGVNMSILLLKSGLLKRELIPILSTLIEGGRITALVPKSVDRGRRPLLFFANPVPPHVLINATVVTSKQLEAML